MQGESTGLGFPLHPHSRVFANEAGSNMKLVRVLLGKTINIGNYESVRVDFTVDLEDSSLEEALGYLETQIESYEQSLKLASESVFKVKRSLRLVEKFCEIHQLSLDDFAASVQKPLEACVVQELVEDDIPF